MKLKLVIMAVTSLLVTGVVNAAEVYHKGINKLDLYGKLNGLYYFSDDTNSNGDKTYVTFGVKGESIINDQLTGYGQWEYGFIGNHNASNNMNGNGTHLAFAGLKFDKLGSFDYGRNYGIAYDVGAFTDVLPEYSNHTWSQNDTFMTNGANNVVTYRNNGFFGLINGLNFAAQYQSKNDHSDVTTSNGNGWGISYSYEIGGFNIASAYTRSDRTNYQICTFSDLNTNEKNNAEVWATGLKYDANNIYLATTYAETYNTTSFGAGHIANRAQNLEMVAQYQFDFGLRPSLAYLYSKARDIDSYGNQNLVKYIEIGTTYLFNSNMSTYIDYKLNLLDNNEFTKSVGIATDDIVAVGLTYRF